MCPHEEDLQAYSVLKLELASKFPQDILQYCLGKDAFVAGIDAKDGYHGWRMVQPLTHREWEAVRRFRRGYFVETSKDPIPPMFDHPDHMHFVYYLNSEIDGRRANMMNNTTVVSHSLFNFYGFRSKRFWPSRIIRDDFHISCYGIFFHCSTPISGAQTRKVYVINLFLQDQPRPR